MHDRGSVGPQQVRAFECEAAGVQRELPEQDAEARRRERRRRAEAGGEERIGEGQRGGLRLHLRQACETINVVKCRAPTVDFVGYSS